LDKEPVRLPELGLGFKYETSLKPSSECVFIWDFIVVSKGKINYMIRFLGMLFVRGIWN